MPVLVDRVCRLRRRVPVGRPVLLGLTGEPGAGKSTLAEALVDHLAARDVCAVLVPMDGFHLANVALARLGRAGRKGAPDTFDGAGYVALLARLRAGTGDVVWAPTYDRSVEESVAGAVAVPPGTDVVVTEGNYLLLEEHPWGAVRDHLDEVWAVRLDAERRTARLFARHLSSGKPPEAAAAWVAAVDEGNARLVRGTLPRADLQVEQTP